LCSFKKVGKLEVTNVNQQPAHDIQIPAQNGVNLGVKPVEAVRQLPLESLNFSDTPPKLAEQL
jgi:hypothetical protein